MKPGELHARPCPSSLAKISWSPQKEAGGTRWITVISRIIETMSGTKPQRTQRVGGIAAMQLGDRAGEHDQQQEGEDADSTARLPSTGQVPSEASLVPIMPASTTSPP